MIGSAVMLGGPDYGDKFIAQPAKAAPPPDVLVADRIARVRKQ